LALAVWFLVSAISRAGRSSRRPPTDPDLRSQPPPQLTLGRYPAASKRDRLNLMLGELQNALNEAEKVRRRGSLEIEPEGKSLENVVARADRREVDLDDEAEAVAARRITAAAARDQAQPSAISQPSSSQIRQEPADHTATHGYTRQQLRDAVVWREILGPPVSER
jgi:hypothetical protein